VRVNQPSDEDKRLIYQVVATRRLQWDNLVWQVPLLSLTAQAFLFSIALAPDSHRSARALAAVLSIVMSFLCITLMARHRQAEQGDAKWLNARETEFADAEQPGADLTWVVHGDPWLARRKQMRADWGVFNIVPPLPGYRTWVVGLFIFFVAALAILVVDLFWPALLTHLLG
jgi:hypothetical protein